jgi:hypothetical protein
MGDGAFLFLKKKTLDLEVLSPFFTKTTPLQPKPFVRR